MGISRKLLCRISLATALIASVLLSLFFRLSDRRESRVLLHHRALHSQVIAQVYSPNPLGDSTTPVSGLADPSIRLHIHNERYTRALNGQPLKIEGPTKGIAFLLTLRRPRLTSTKIWNNWSQEASHFIKKKLNKSSQVYRIYINHMGTAPSTRLPPLPNAFRAPDCPTGTRLAECQLKLLAYAMEDFPEAQYFVHLTDGFSPVKPFARIYKDVEMDTRIRTHMRSFCASSSGLPRATSARGFSRGIGSILVSNPGWAVAPTVSGCSAAECRIWGPIFSHFGEEEAPVQFLVKEQDDDLLPSFISATFVECFGIDLECIDTGDTFGEPFQYTNVTREWIDTLIRTPNVWFFRGFSDRTIVSLIQVRVTDHLHTG
eukprot:Protomagalhaensia_sp_Gyna_25__2125@NODE_214_length_4362_cov_74_083738_g166_i0_p1_GENE_NODE_214_length_4362_cov_74_083738_g166_i0NODE_214_length_4362_cov_74_083738_g166_i0_p1_ORF_typecomplete_len374_score44_38Branch/PF02485_21/0_00029_NODE_214_length_4362_cov_74_083738_g166_i018022923